MGGPEKGSLRPTRLLEAIGGCFLATPHGRKVGLLVVKSEWGGLGTALEGREGSWMLGEEGFAVFFLDK